ncbi:hypothetical protein IMY05_011G0014100 [Salix suchowensis]|nr:hypothetical protein IMY05_011G0014100 [Salix suchowensis]
MGKNVVSDEEDEMELEEEEEREPVDGDRIGRDDDDDEEGQDEYEKDGFIVDDVEEEEVEEEEDRADNYGIGLRPACRTASFPGCVRPANNETLPFCYDFYL